MPHALPVLRGDAHFCRNWIGFFLLGLSNTLPYAMVSAAANPIARSYKEDPFVGTIYGVVGSTAILVRSLNTFVLTRVPYNIRFTINAFVLALGSAGVAYAPDFGMAIFAIVVIGTGYAFGENLALGYLSKFDSRLVNAWSSGTGCGGMMGAGMLLLFGCVLYLPEDRVEQLRIIDRYSFIACSPIVIVYLIAYFLVIRQPSDSERRLGTVNRFLSNGRLEYDYIDDDERRSLVDSEREPAVPASPGDPGNVLVPSRTLSHRWNCFKLVWKLGVNLSLVTFASYVCRVASAKTEDHSIYDSNCPALYTSLQLCYHAGEFASRSSVQLFKIRYVGILMIIQILNAAVWSTDIIYNFLPVYILPAYMVLVGLIGGAVYVNTFYMVHNDEKYPNKDRELLANITGVFITVGVSLCSIIMTVLYNTSLKPY